MPHTAQLPTHSNAVRDKLKLLTAKYLAHLETTYQCIVGNVRPL